MLSGSQWILFSEHKHLLYCKGSGRNFLTQFFIVFYVDIYLLVIIFLWILRFTFDFILLATLFRGLEVPAWLQILLPVALKLERDCGRELYGELAQLVLNCGTKGSILKSCWGPVSVPLIRYKKYNIYQCAVYRSTLPNTVAHFIAAVPRMTGVTSQVFFWSRSTTWRHQPDKTGSKTLAQQPPVGHFGGIVCRFKDHWPRNGP